jgi:hypothetical protein
MNLSALLPSGSVQADGAELQIEYTDENDDS